MGFLLSKEEVDEKIGALSEAQRIEFRRRVDACYAVTASLDPLVFKRVEMTDALKDANSVVKARNAFILFGGAVLVYWLGDAMELSWLRGIASLIGFGAVATLIGKLVDDYVGRARLSNVEQAIADLRFHWLASGAHQHEFDAYCALVTKLGTRPEWEDAKEVDRAMRSEVLQRVADLVVRV
jgi:hypothetical protein